MEILVNSEPLDFALENEESLGELVDGLQAWLTEGMFTITSLDVDNTAYPIHDRRSWGSVSLDTVERLSVEALPRDKADQTTLLALDEYLSMLHDALTAENREAVADLAGEVEYVEQRIVQYFPTLASDSPDQSPLQSDALRNRELPGHDERQRLLTAIGHLRTLFANRAREYAFPVREMALTLGQLKAASEELEQVPVLLQTGQGAIAMKSVISLTELLGRLYRLTPLVEADGEQAGLDLEGIKRFTQETGDVLAELQQAFEINDTVLIGDLLEYEVAPRLKTVAELFPTHESQ